MTGDGVAGAWVAMAAGRLADLARRPAAEARALLAAAVGVTAERLFAYPERPLAAAEAAAADRLLARRLAGEPLSRIVGRREFWSLPFALGPDTLDPRADTETVVQAALAAWDGGAPARLLDLGVGSGCILLALLHEWPQATGVGVDLSQGAVRIARNNAARLGMLGRTSLLVGNWGAALAAGAFDLVVANPPYIATTGGAAPEPAVVAHDPPLALFAGADGLDAYRAILPDLPRLLTPEGFAAIEIGAGQDRAVSALAAAAGLEATERVRDLNGHIRCLGVRRAIG